MDLTLETAHVSCTSSCLYWECVAGNNQDIRCRLNCSSHLWADFHRLFLHLVTEASQINQNYLSQFN